MNNNITNYFIDVFSKDDIEIASNIFVDVYNNNPFNYTWIKVSDVKRYFEHLCGNNKFLAFTLVEKNTKQPVGFCIGMIDDFFGSSNYKITEIFLKQNISGNGLGSAFLQAIENELSKNNFDAVLLETSSTLPAYNFYKKNQYIELEDIVKFAKTLKK